ncbi:hypothetical protein HDE_09460 [Halotydeus destructor]|nr:hypothetical protein HDE_09460 [Halotydeus destructor]
MALNVAVILATMTMVMGGPVVDDGSRTLTMFNDKPIIFINYSPGMAAKTLSWLRSANLNVEQLVPEMDTYAFLSDLGSDIELEVTLADKSLSSPATGTQAAVVASTTPVTAQLAGEGSAIAASVTQAEVSATQQQQTPQLAATEETAPSTEETVPDKKAAEPAEPAILNRKDAAENRKQQVVQTLGRRSWGQRRSSRARS